jgi:two-component system response regulator DesR
MSQAENVIRVVMADDQRMVLEALAALLDMESDISVVKSVTDGEAALAAVLEIEPDILLTDIEMPKLGGLEVAERLRGKADAKVVVLTTFARAGYLQRAQELGASGYLLKTRPASELADALRRIRNGGRVVDPELAAEAWGEVDPLTDRERDVLRLTYRGLSTKDIASELSLSAGTVRNYLSVSIEKLRAVNRFDAARIARDKGWL